MRERRMEGVAGKKSGFAPSLRRESAIGRSLK